MSRKCTDTKPCQMMNCYACRRALIDRTAQGMLDSGVAPEQVDRYRYPAINALAWEIPSVAQVPKATARKAPEVLTADAIENALIVLRKCTSRAGARKVLEWFKVAELRQITKAIELGACSRLRRDELIEHVIDFTVQMKLDHDAILNVR